MKNKTVKFISILEVCDIIPSDDIALISIREPGSGENLYIHTHFASKKLELKYKWKNICILEFEDTKRPIKNAVIFSDYHAKKIIAFLNKMRDKTIIVHCFAGISRSAAVAFFIHKNYGYKIIGDYNINEN